MDRKRITLPDRIFHTIENGKSVSHKETVLALVQQCKDRGLTVRDAKFVLRIAIRYIEASENQSLLANALMSSSDF